MSSGTDCALLLGIMRTSARLSWAATVLIAGGLPALSMHGAHTHESPASPVSVSVFRDIARRLKPSVVTIETRGRANPQHIEPDEWFDRLFGLHPPRVRHQVGAGVLISVDGDILTNDHVITDADTIDIHLFGDERKTYRAHVVGHDPISDSALLRLDDGPRDFAAATLGDSSALEAGDWVMSIGSPFHLDHSVSVGIVSHDTRAFEVEEGRWQRLVQIDGSINPGNSGGPLIDLFGEVVGLNIGTMADAAAAGIGFALPINTVRAVLPQLRAGSVVHGDIGVRPRNGRISEDDAAALGLPSAAGVLIRSVEPGSSADRGGLQAGDVILDFAGTRVESADELMTQVWNTKPGTRARTGVVHNGEMRTLSIDVDRLAASPAREPRPADEPDSLGLTFADTPGHRITSGGTLLGAIVQSLEDDSPAEHAGLQKGDLIRRINRRAITSAADATQELRRLGSGHTAFLLVWRDGHDTLLEMQRD
jgi:serine protease Do